MALAIWTNAIYLLSKSKKFWIYSQFGFVKKPQIESSGTQHITPLGVVRFLQCGDFYWIDDFFNEIMHSMDEFFQKTYSYPFDQWSRPEWSTRLILSIKYLFSPFLIILCDCEDCGDCECPTPYIPPEWFAGMYFYFPKWKST